jgi:hypothetical protein
MSKSTATYWNALDKSNADKWEVIEGSDDQLKRYYLLLMNKMVVTLGFHQAIRCSNSLVEKPPAFTNLLLRKNNLW